MAREIRNQNQKKKKNHHLEPSIPIVARLAIQGYAECPQYINLLPSVKRGRGGGEERGGERGKRKKREGERERKGGEEKRRGEGREKGREERGHVHGK